MEAAIKVLSSYAGRDKTMRTVGYVAMMLSGATDGKAARSLNTVSAQISATRVVLRLFDDLPMWGHAFTYGYGAHVRGIADSKSPEFERILIIIIYLHI